MRDNRKRNVKDNNLTEKIMWYTGIGIVALGIIVFALFMYSKRLSEDVKNSTINLEEMSNIANNTSNETESTSTDIGKTVEEATNELNLNSTNNVTTGTNTANTIKQTNTVKTTKTTNTSKQTSNSSTNNTKKATTNSTVTNVTTNNTNTNTTNNTNTAEKKKELVFAKPVAGDIVREYAKDNLIYSDTLEEWTTHLGIDIKADKTTVVNAAEAGTVKSIKNDPRYGLTIVIEHDDVFQTVYSNLLTSEFVVEGEKVQKGQAIGTVGNTGVFEITDDPHLHFEILKDSLQVDPSIYIK